MNLTKHFTLEELTRSATAERLGLDNSLPPLLLNKMKELAEMLERIRAALGKPMIITSGYRSPSVNRAVGGRTSSDHAMGMAADFVCPAFGTPYQVAKRLVEADVEIGQLILEGVKGKQWVHVSTDPPKNPINRVITITDAGTFTGVRELLV